ncbi:hypothetical protein BMS3Bbin11_00545 [bacterium BMS3Bbin11]|nr:hypothetical protein BMS3Abin11_00191 [bacterium BMS3Abin11]GBE45457.1 hypothetical protein BMS3Bbin11_00545 [bacterium BMS3Bbin11]GMT40743.1 MAG: hypothetical protein IEMM0001_1478 [bacterium]HDH15190.1 hypothetical protein [Gammaproteobacteria bacterium]
MQFKYVRGIIFTILALSLTKALAAETEVTVLMLNEQDSQNEPAYISRMLLTRDFLRLDDGDDHGNFALFDRKTGSIYSVNNEDQRILVIPLQPVLAVPPNPLRNDIEELDAGGVPDVDGKKVSRYYMVTNGNRCMEVYAVPGYLDDVTRALAAFARTLAGQHAKTIAAMPDLKDADCDLANNIFEPDRYLSKGFPVRQKDYAGRTRSLVSVKDKVVFDSSMFGLPEGYKRFMPGVFSK